MVVELNQQQNISGDPDLANQGFGRVNLDTPPKHYDPTGELENAALFFEENGFVVLGNCLNQAELFHLNEFFDRTQREEPGKWGLGSRKPHHRDQGLIFSQPILDYPELDNYTQHVSSFPLVARLLGGKAAVRFSELNFRETPKKAGVGHMNFHHDAVTEDRFLRKPYNPVDWLCAIHYLTDTKHGTPTFCVVPKSNRYKDLREAYSEMGNNYEELPLYGQAGTCVLYDTAIFHTRYDGDGLQRRRTWHQYYARGGWLRSSLPTSDRYVRAPSPCLTDWNLIPERLAFHEDREVRMYFSHWNTAQCEWVASGFDPNLRKAMPRGEQ